MADELSVDGKLMTRTWLVPIVLALVAGGEFAQADEPPPQTQLNFSGFQHADDRATAEVAGNQATIRIRSSTGIGYLDVRPKPGNWPAQVTVLWENLRELEHVQLSCGRLYVQGSRKTSGKFELYFLPANGDFAQRSKIGTAEVRVEVRPEGVAIVLPGRLLDGQDQVHLAWIDWLRG